MRLHRGAHHGRLGRLVPLVTHAFAGPRPRSWRPGRHPFADIGGCRLRAAGGFLRPAFAKGFFDLQLSLAEAVRDLSGASLEDALLQYTNLYARFGFGRDFEAAHEGWRRYLEGLRGAADGREWSYRFYRAVPEATEDPRFVATFGCFSCARPEGRVVRLHFRDADRDGGSPLGRDRAGRRRAELAALFARLEPSVRRDTPVVGASWLYHLAAYRRLFPPEYVSSPRPIQGAFRSMALWGQFVDRFGEVRKSSAESFLDSLAGTSKLGDLEGCFPLQALTVSAPAGAFYDYYGV